MTKEQKVNRKDVLPMVESIKKLTEKIAEIVESIPEGYIRTSYTTSVKNLRVKNTNFLTVKTGGPRGLSAEEKAVIEKMRAEKAALSEVPADNADAKDSVAPKVAAKKSKKKQ